MQFLSSVAKELSLTPSLIEDLSS